MVSVTSFKQTMMLVFGGLTIAGAIFLEEYNRTLKPSALIPIQSFNKYVRQQKELGREL